VTPPLCGMVSDVPQEARAIFERFTMESWFASHMSNAALPNSDERPYRRHYLWRTATLFARFRELLPEHPNIRPEFAFGLEDRIVGVLQYAAYRERHPCDEEDPTAVGFRRAVRNFPGNYNILRPSEAEFLSTIFSIEVFAHLACNKQVAPDCFATTGYEISVYRRHEGAQNFYAVNMLIDHLYFDEYSARIFRGDPGRAACWRCLEYDQSSHRKNL
jgi:hypothetical protein